MKSADIKTIVKRSECTGKNGEKIVYPEVCETTLFGLFKLVKGNRDKKPNHIEVMSNSIINHGVLRDTIVFRYNYNYYTGDGQHLTEALERFGGNVKVRFKLIDVKNEAEMFSLVASINGSQVRFSLKEYIEGWSNFNPEYKILLDFKKEFGITYRVLATILTGMKGKAVEAIQKGSFSIVNLEAAKRKISLVYDFKTNTGKKLDAYGVAGLLKFIDTVTIDEYENISNDFIRMAEKLYKDYGLLDKNLGRADDNLQFFNEVYNAIK